MTFLKFKIVLPSTNKSKITKSLVKHMGSPWRQPNFIILVETIINYYRRRCRNVETVLQVLAVSQVSQISAVSAF